MPSQDITNTVTACPIEPRIRELERAVTFARGAAVVVTAVLSLTSGAVGVGAMATRDAGLAHGARITALESGASSNEAARSRREEFDRVSREQLIEVRSDLQALRREVENLSHILQRREEQEDGGGGRPPRSR